MSNGYEDDEWYKSSDTVLPYHICHAMESLGKSLVQNPVDPESVKLVRKRLIEMSRILEAGYKETV